MACGFVSALTNGSGMVASLSSGMPWLALETVSPVNKRKVVPDSIVYLDNWKGCNVLDMSGFHHFQINHPELFTDNQIHINGIEIFLDQTKRHMQIFNCVPKAHIGLLF